MKKAYVKPALYAEQFTLTEHISAACGYATNFGNNCAITVDGITYFTSLENHCSQQALDWFRENEIEPKDATINTLMSMNVQCYNSFADFGQLFTSA